MLSDRAKKNIGIWRLALLHWKRFLQPEMKNTVARTWMATAHSHLDRAEDLRAAAKEMDPVITAKPLTEPLVARWRDGFVPPPDADGPK